jgi:hypothetical protein
MMWKLCEFQQFRGAQEVFSRLTAVCCMLLPHNPYRLPQHYKRHVCGPFCSCKHRFLWVSPIFEHYFCLNYMGTVHQGQPCWTTTGVRFIGLCWYFNPQWAPEQVINKASCVANNITHWQNCAVPMNQIYKLGFFEGCRRWRGSILATQRSHELQASCSIPKTVVFQTGVNTKFLQTLTHSATPLWVIWLFKWLTAWPIYGSFGVKGLIDFTLNWVWQDSTRWACLSPWSIL